MKLKDSQKVFTALSDESRLRILNLLNEGELCVCDVIKVLKEPQSKISRHLSYLRRAGLVEARKDGLWVHYRLSKPASKIYATLLKTVSGCCAEMDECCKDLKTLHANKDNLIGCCK
jgi:ArsR family transcriptional regulator